MITSDDQHRVLWEALTTYENVLQSNLHVVQWRKRRRIEQDIQTLRSMIDNFNQRRTQS
jgi:ABC-type histidine transport system ATPase subunit